MAKPPKITDAQFQAAMRKWRMCGKVAFEQEEKAQRKAKELGYSYYPCPYCFKYHLSKRKPILLTKVVS